MLSVACWSGGILEIFFGGGMVVFLALYTVMFVLYRHLYCTNSQSTRFYLYYSNQPG